MIRLPKLLRTAVEVLLDLDLPVRKVSAWSKRRAARKLADVNAFVAIERGRAELAERKRDAAAVLAVIRPANTVALARELHGIAPLALPFGDYVRALEMAWSEGDSYADDALTFQMENDARLDESEKTLLLEARSEIALRLLEAELHGVIGEAEQ